MAAYTRLIEAGMNVLCHGGGAMYAWDFDPEPPRRSMPLPARTA